jgi:hypothetical protein
MMLTKKQLIQLFRFWSSACTPRPIRRPKPSQILRDHWFWLYTAWAVAAEVTEFEGWQATADIAASCALSDAAAPRGKRA